MKHAACNLTDLQLHCNMQLSSMESIVQGFLERNKNMTKLFTSTILAWKRHVSAENGIISNYHREVEVHLVEIG